MNQREKKKRETNFQKQFSMLKAHFMITDYWLSGSELDNPQITSFFFFGYSTPLY